MEPIQFDANSYRAGGQPIFLLSGEFHYFRVPKIDWRRRMRLFKEAGGNCLATYIPWLIHEPEEGQFRFTGEDWLDLEDFLETAQAEGLYVIARPGPYQYSELIYHGLPGWLVQKYPEVLARNANGQVIGYASVSYTHPLFLEKVRSWFNAVCPILARYTVENGGPVAFTQIDNELVGIHEWFGSLDYHPASMGIGQPGGQYPQFLEQRYGTLEKLNQAYHSQYGGFESVQPVPQPGQPAAACLRVRKDYFDFYLSTIADYAQFLGDLIHEHGIHTPIMHNSANPGMNAYFLETRERLGSQFLLGSDHYFNLDQTWPQNNPTPQYAARVFVSLEMLRLLGYPPSVLEMPGGSASDWPPLTPGDALAAYMTNLAFGMKGMNYYIFTGGPNPPGAGNTTDLYDYGASISARGDIRPLFKAQESFGQFVHSHADWLTSTRLSDFRIAMDLEHARAEQYWPERGPFLFSSADSWGFMRKGVLSSALCASLSPEFINLGSDDWLDETRTPLVIPTSVCMGAEKQRRVVEFLRRGGKAVITPILPTLDEHFEPYTLLADYLGTPQQAQNTAGLARPRILGTVNVNGTIFPFERLPEQAETIGVDEFSGRPIAAKIHPQDGGQVVLLGLSWTQAMREHERMLTEVLTSLGCNPVIRCSDPNLWVTAYTNQHTLTVFVANLLTSTRVANLKVYARDHWIDVENIEIPSVSVGAFDFPL